MTREDKELLLKDLSARLTYEVKFLRESWNYEWDQELSVIEVLEDIDKDGFINNTKVYTVEDIKPYLRPMSSMTEEERNEVNNLIKCNRPTPYGKINNKGIDNLLSSVSVTSGVLIDWLNAHHFDYRGLIEAGLALEAPEEMYNLNKE